MLFNEPKQYFCFFNGFFVTTNAVILSQRIDEKGLTVDLFLAVGRGTIGMQHPVGATKLIIKKV